MDDTVKITATNYPPAVSVAAAFHAVGVARAALLVPAPVRTRGVLR